MQIYQNTIIRYGKGKEYNINALICSDHDLQARGKKTSFGQLMPLLHQLLSLEIDDKQKNQGIGCLCALYGSEQHLQHNNEPFANIVFALEMNVGYDTKTEQIVKMIKYTNYLYTVVISRNKFPIDHGILSRATEFGISL